MTETCNCKCHLIMEAEMETFCLRCDDEFADRCSGAEANWDARAEKRRKR